MKNNRPTSLRNPKSCSHLFFFLFNQSQEKRRKKIKFWTRASTGIFPGHVRANPPRNNEDFQPDFVFECKEEEENFCVSDDFIFSFQEKG